MSGYPKSSFKRKILEHAEDVASGMRLSKEAQALIYLEYVLFMKQMVATSSQEANKENSTHIDAQHIEKASEAILRHFRG